MRKLLSLIVLFFYVFTSAQAQEYKGSAAAERFPGADWLRVKPGHQLPDFIRLNPASQFDLKDLQSWMAGHFNLSGTMGFVMLRTENDRRAEMIHHRCKQTYRAYPVWDADFIAHTRNGKVEAINGTLYGSVIEGNSVHLTDSEALVIALDYMNASLYTWEIPGEDELLREVTGNDKATHYPSGQLVMFPSGQGMHRYAWMFTIYARQPLRKSELFVDAQSGEILRDNDKIYESDTSGIAITKYLGQKGIKTQLNNETTFRLRESGRGLGIETYNMLQSDVYANAVDFTDTDNFWNNVNAQQDEIATDAHFGTEMTYDYFKYKHGRNSINDQGFLLRSYVHYMSGFANAFWDGNVMTYGDGDNNYSPFTTLDICGHEISHGLTEFTANLTYSYESGALNEGYSDIFGTMVEFYGDTLGANWLMGEDIGDPIRSISDPNQFGQPDTYLGDGWATGGGDNGGVHTNSGVINFWFYLAAEGGNGVNDNNDSYSVTAIGRDKAADVAYRTLTVYLTPNMDYADARFYSIVSAIDLFGECSAEVESVTDAMYAVGIGNPFSPGVSCDFDVALQSYCSLPAQVSFSNETSNGLTFSWDFGDGSSSSQFEPSHNYTAAGVYSVKLIAEGGDCGSDTLLKISYITVDPPLAPLVTSAAHCGGPASLTLLASAPDTVRWFTTPAGGTAFHTGTSYTTPVLSNSAIYYVENQEIAPHVYGGKINKSSGGAYYTNFTSHYQVFDVFEPVRIKSVKVYADVAGWRNIELRDAQGVPVISTNVNIPLGESRITLNFDVLPGTEYRLAGPTEPSLYRDNSGCNYPYTIPGLLSITHSSAGGANGTSYYYYFYDWEVIPQPCISERVMCAAYINSGLPTASFTSVALPPGVTVVFTNTGNDGNTFLWNFGDGTTSTAENPVHTYAAEGTYTVSLEVSNACGNASAMQQQSIVLGVEEMGFAGSLQLVPNPAGHVVEARYAIPGEEEARLQLMDMLGRVRYESFPPKQSGDQRVRILLDDLASGVYSVIVTTNRRRMVQRLVVE